MKSESRESGILTLVKAILSRRVIGIPCTLALRSLGRISDAMRVARLCRLTPEIVKIRGQGAAFRMSGAGGRDQIPNLIWWYGREHEPPMPRVLGALARQSRVIVDVGANTGFYTLLTAARSNGVVHSYEPYPIARDCLLANLRLNPELASRVRYHEAAVGNRTGTAKFYIPIPMADHGLIETSCSLDRDFREVDHEIEVPVVTLDSEFADKSDAPVDLIKIDVEGMEASVIEGARELIINRRPWVTIEILDAKYEQAIAVSFEGLDYRLVALVADRIEILPHFARIETTDNYLAAPVEKMGDLKRLAASLGLACYEVKLPIYNRA